MKEMLSFGDLYSLPFLSDEEMLSLGDLSLPFLSVEEMLSLGDLFIPFLALEETLPFLSPFSSFEETFSLGVLVGVFPFLVTEMQSTDSLLDLPSNSEDT